MIRTIRRSVLYYLLTVFTASTLLIWNGYTRYQEYRQFHQELAQQSVGAAAEEIELQLSELRHRVYLFAEEQTELIGKLALQPDEEILYFQLESKIDRYFKDRLAFTVTDAAGDVQVQDVEIEIGESCQTDIRDYASNQQFANIYIHPQSDGYHFDIIVPWAAEDGRTGTFFISFHTNIISRLLSISEVRGHQLLLLRDEIGGIIELTPQGNRESMDRDFHLSPDEKERILQRRPIDDTRWLLVDLADEGLLIDLGDVIARETGVLIVMLAIITFVMFRFLQKSEQSRYLAEAELRRTQHELSLQVRDRTTQLNQAQSSLQSEMDVRMHIQKMLKVREATIRSLLTCAPNPILAVNQDGEVVSVNRQAGRLFGYPEEEMIDQPISQFIIETNDSHIFARRHENLQAHEVSDCVDQQTVIVLQKDGGRVPVRVSVSESRAGRQHVFTAFLSHAGAT